MNEQLTLSNGDTLLSTIMVDSATGAQSLLKATILKSKDTQKTRILKTLTHHGRDGICLHDLARDDAYTARNRISELRREGYRIESKPCQLHNHRSSISRYWLENNEGNI